MPGGTPSIEPFTRMESPTSRAEMSISTGGLGVGDGVGVGLGEGDGVGVGLGEGDGSGVGWGQGLGPGPGFGAGDDDAAWMVTFTGVEVTGP